MGLAAAAAAVAVALAAVAMGGVASAVVAEGVLAAAAAAQVRWRSMIGMWQGALECIGIGCAGCLAQSSSWSLPC